MWWLMASLAVAGGYTRVSEDSDVLRLELASRTLSHPEHGDVTLVGVAHIADAAFYADTQGRLDQAEVVLYEGVKDADATGDDPALHEAYAGLASALGLAFQQDEIAYDRDNWHNSDLSVQELTEGMTAKGQDPGPVLDLLNGGRELRKMGKLSAKAEKSALVRAMARIMLVESLPRAEGVMASALGDEMYEWLVVERNDAVYVDLIEQRDAAVSVLYGAGHLMELEGRLIADGYTVADEVWTPAITVDPQAEGVSPKVVELVRKKVVRKLDKMGG